ncbi:MAG: hypothetical protein JWR35_2674 [Marmoricola sp.]|nr:hypothetical protein [Marmoricola sp.]
MNTRTLVVVPTLGIRPELLRLCLDSIRMQGIENLDLVVVAPPGPEIEAITAEFGGAFVPDPEEGGQSGAINAGIGAAAPGTAYFAWLGDDDLLRPHSLETAIRALADHPHAPMVFGWCDYIDEAGNIVFVSRAGRLANRVLGWGPNLIPQPGSLMRYDDVVAVGGVDENCRFAMDLDLFLRLRKRGELVAIPVVLAAFRRHADSITVRDERDSLDEADRIRMGHMTPAAARTYKYLRWPGRWALKAARRRVDRNARRQLAAVDSPARS